ncbi:MAG: ATP-binding cassette domain-containing protein [Candidatus Thiodiazotropha lotti]|uniref:Phosphonate C-P lyase system protein PhnK n=1 Tax=Candidatus Thiodiazotropha endoloripes TaxID=1818881 RepID=A0A1E2UID9_9GAMM|nr:ATP-binding cassette domain-containing protein [Candidatus Thiodiazotropha endoloripes]MCG7897246.1 ATP-binding cassette domain-containing protein [Candidatus Thiodiazotropha weberae]MCG7993079.1 ATP-binding cassette domain-containing protein [Candidatus Thiodiazotropha lotti]MCG7902528.1 ATP-binding cassette domain-containing protein [Candidatus Thiodiazotropha weberae]MCG7913563.1 ATP-binding cassette domain-containing protein [Candidatus Thiodiazotropha weberae]MCG8000213.1 ATP-binding c
MDEVLSVSGLSKRYGRGCPACYAMTGPQFETNICPQCGSVVAAHDVSFNLYQGEILGIMGESGSGKSTAVKCLYFDEEPSMGSAQFFDQGMAYQLFDLNKAQQRRLANQRFGMVYQNPHLGLNFDISAGGNIAERLLMSNADNYKQIRQRAVSLLSRTEVLTERMDEMPRNFSGGMQQRVQIAKALATNPPLLFLDEVTTGLDLSVQAAILDLILEIQQQSRTSMIVVTHDLGVIRLLADRTLVMKYGRVIESGLTDQILEDPQHAYTQRLVASAL